MDAKEAKTLIESYREELRAKRERLGRKLRPLGLALGISLAAGGTACSDDDNDLPPVGDAYGVPDIYHAVDMYGGVDAPPYDLPPMADAYGVIDSMPADAGPDLPDAVDVYGAFDASGKKK